MPKVYLPFGWKKKQEELVRSAGFNGGDRVLDIGTGNSPNYLSWAKGKITCTDIRSTSRINVQCDGNFLPFRENSFDKVMAMGSLYFFAEPSRVIQEISRVTKKNGIFIFYVPFIYPLHDEPVDKYRFTKYGISEILKGHFKVRKIEPIGGVFSLPMLIVYSLIKGLPQNVPKRFRSAAQLFSYALLPIFFFFKIFDYLNKLDKFNKWPNHYFVIAEKI